jgi:hypothetical protein
MKTRQFKLDFICLCGGHNALQLAKTHSQVSQLCNAKADHGTDRKLSWNK